MQMVEMVEALVMAPRSRLARMHPPPPLLSLPLPQLPHLTPRLRILRCRIFKFCKPLLLSRSLHSRHFFKLGLHVGIQSCQLAFVLSLLHVNGLLRPAFSRRFHGFETRDLRLDLPQRVGRCVQKW